ncbi:MAG: HlyD family type I secretion periplasmic adaptor subunit [Sphingomonadales bacterium]
MSERTSSRPQRFADITGFAAQAERLETKTSSLLLIVITTAVVIFLGWAAIFELDQVTRAEGRVLPSARKQMVQHFEGGIISDIAIEEGQVVRKGDLLLRIQNQISQAELVNTRWELLSNQVELQRRRAEAAGTEDIDFPDDLRDRAPELIDEQLVLFTTRRAELGRQLAVLDDQIRKRTAELQETRIRLNNLKEEEKLLRQRLAQVEKLVAMDAGSEAQLIEVKTKLQQLISRISDARYQIPQLDAALSETRNLRKQRLVEFQSQAQEEVVNLQLSIAKLEEALSAFQDRSARTDVRAPITGVVNTIFVSTLGGVVQPGQDLVEIVPNDSSVLMEAKLRPSDRGDVWPGLPTIVKITAYDYSIYGGLDGNLEDISADVLQDEQGQSYYRIRVKAETSSFGDDKPVIPGMTAQIDILSGRHTILNYILKPIFKLRDNALRQ